MDNELKEKFGPCGLLCEKCFAYHEGSIQKHASQLMKSLGNFTPYANRFVSLLNEPGFKNYKNFEEILALFEKGNCKGCRTQQCKLFKACKVKDCHITQGVDFCFQCEKFPCINTGFDEHLKHRWLSINNKIRAIGLNSYYNEIKNKSRY
jgi:hypothetical protein